MNPHFIFFFFHNEFTSMESLQIKFLDKTKSYLKRTTNFSFHFSGHAKRELINESKPAANVIQYMSLLSININQD